MMLRFRGFFIRIYRSGFSGNHLGYNWMIIFNSNLRIVGTVDAQMPGFSFGDPKQTGKNAQICRVGGGGRHPLRIQGGIQPL